jgi:transcription antitermination factor NusG
VKDAGARVRFEADSGGYPRELLATPRWYAVRTRARSEKRVDASLKEAGIESFPAVSRVRRDWSDRTQEVGMPLFPGYVFARFCLNDVTRALSRPGVVGIVKSKGVPQPLKPEEMEAVRILVDGVTETGELPTNESFLAVGDPVVVTDGPFQGMEGILVEERGATRLVVRVPAIRQAKGVELGREMVRGRKG